MCKFMSTIASDVCDELDYLGSRILVSNGCYLNSYQCGSVKTFVSELVERTNGIECGSNQQNTDFDTLETKNCMVFHLTRS